MDQRPWQISTGKLIDMQKCALSSRYGEGSGQLMLPSLCRILCLTWKALALGVHVLNNWVRGILALLNVVRAWGKHMTMEYLDP